MNTISIAIKNFNDRVKQMNQTNSKQLILSADEARNLHSDIYNLLYGLAELKTAASNQTTENTSNEIQLDGGGF